MRKLLPLVVAAGLLAGCGSDSDTADNNTYIEQLNVAQTTFTADTGRVVAGIGGQDSVSEYRGSMRRLERVAGAFVTGLRAIKVPGAVSAAHTGMVRAASDYAKAINEAGTVLRDPTPSRLALVPGQVQRASTLLDRRLRSATNDINSTLGDG